MLKKYILIIKKKIALSQKIIMLLLLITVTPLFWRGEGGEVNAQSFQWLTRMGGISSDPNFGPDEMVRDIDVDSAGNVYACGRIRQFANFNGTPVTTYGSYDIFIAKYNCQGNLIWVKTAGSLFHDDAFSLTLDGLGYIYMTGKIDADSTLPNTFFDTVITEYTVDMFLAKFDTSGNYLWGKFAGPGTQNTFSQGFNVVIDANGNPNVHVSTALAGVLFPGWNVNAAPYIAKFDTSGTLQQIFTFSSNYSLEATDFAMDALNNYFICGFWVSDSVLIGNQTFYSPQPGTGMYVFYTAKFNNAGVFQWAYMFTDTLTSPHGSLGYGINFDSNNNILATGSVVPGLKCGNYVFSNTPTFNSPVPFVFKLNQQGQPIWAAQGYQQFTAYNRGGVALKSNGNAVLSGAYRGIAVFNSDTLTQSFNGSQDLFLAEVDPNGQMLGAVKLGCTGSSAESFATITDPSDNVYLAGTFNATLSANGNSVTNAGGYTDGFIAKYGFPCTTGLEENTKSKNGVMELSPNPVQDYVNINLHNAYNGKAWLMINDMMGKLILEQIINLNTGRMFLPLKPLPAGIYSVTVTCPTKGVFTQKLISFE